ncbi:MAG TPA: S41 family peptidase [Ramlibacter sp.]|nr:S41 family peptidase [Ramlibacter sp.]
MKARWAAWWAALLAAALIAGCGGGAGSADAGAPEEPAPTTATPAPDVQAGPATCAVADQRAWLRAWLQEQYLWPSELRLPDEAALSMDAYYRSMLPTQDRFSFTQLTESYRAFSEEGSRIGFGYSLVFTDAQRTTLKVRHVESLSPVGLAGLRRGETVLSLDGYGPQAIAAGLPAPAGQAGVPRQFVVRDAAGAVRSFTAVSAVYPLTPVGAPSVIALETAAGPRRVGYLAYHDFLDNSAGALGAAFSQFASSGVTDLVLDLRYNGGGSVTMARNLASLIAGRGLEGWPFILLRFNSAQAQSNSRFDFIATRGVFQTDPLQGLNRVVVIASPSTASASELLVNGMRPYRSVALVGETTFGKPFGFVPRDACGTTYLALNFETINSLGEGGYTAGLAPDCGVADDLDHALGDPAEGRLAAALGLIATGSCPASAPANAQALRRLPQPQPPLGDVWPPVLLP